MAKRRKVPAQPSTVVSIVGPGMRVKGDCESTDTIRIEGVVEGSVTARKGVVIGREGRVTGDIQTADAKIAGAVKGALDIRSRLELAATSVVEGEIRAGRLQLDEGGVVNGSVTVGRQNAAEDGAAPKEQPGVPAGPDSRPTPTRRRSARK